MHSARPRFVVPVWRGGVDEARKERAELDELTSLLGWSDALGASVSAHLARVYGPRRRLVIKAVPFVPDYAQDTAGETQRDLSQCVLAFVRAIAASPRDFELIVPAVHSLRWEAAGPHLAIRVLVAALLRLAFPETAVRDVEPTLKTSCFAVLEVDDLRANAPEAFKLLRSRWVDPVDALTALINDTAFDLAWNWGCVVRV